ncbi:MAG: SusC/RagA family TonB-linked outer membrane protein [Cytophagales bacterium]|nr:MAG: SusC/RagA family TonB-linked outer membrane protein [Cytophagales bacterium]
MKKGLLLCMGLLLSLFISIGAYAQSTVSGVVTDENGEPIPGVTVLVEGTSTGTATDVNGEYTIAVPAGKSLIFQGIGYSSQIVAVNGQSSLDIAMSEDTKVLDQVVITALGLEADRDKQGSSSSNINAVSVVQSGETGIINGLKGKAAGINIIQNTGDPGAGSRIILRGATSITGNLDPLIVVDGIPINNDSYYGAGSSTTAGVAQQNRMNDINPNDIASIEVLKGAPAAALWGSRAANGVIMITTKKGRGAAGKNFTVDYSFSLGLDEINRKVPLQNTYGSGNSGRYQFNPTGGRTWGDRISDRSGAADAITLGAGYFTDGTSWIYPIANGSAGTTKNGGKNSRQTYDPFEYLFKRGVTITNNISVGSADERGSIYASFSDLRQDGIIKANSNYRRTTARLNLTRNLGKIFTLTANAGYTKTYSDRTQQGSNLNGLFLGGLRTSPDFNPFPFVGTYVDAAGNQFLNRQRAYRNPLGSATNSVYDSPLWMMNNIFSNTEVDRFIGKLEFTADPTSWLNIIGRIGYDTYSDVRNDYFPVIAAGDNNGGRFSRQTFNTDQLQADLIARGSYQVGDFLKGTVLLGVGVNERRRSDISVTSRNFTNPFSPPQLDNTTSGNIFPDNATQIIRYSSYYGTLGFEIKEMVFLNAGGRYDMYSTLTNTPNNGVFYPTVDLAFQFSKLIPENSILTFGKIRAGWGQVGRADDPYGTRTVFIGSTVAEGWGPGLDGAGYGGTFSTDAQAGNADLKPEIKTEFELGADLRFLDDRVSVNATYYSNRTDNAILPLPIANSTGVSSQIANVASIENKGFELEITGEILKMGNFSWVTNLNYSRNVNKVTALSPGTTSLFLNGFSGSSSYAVVGAQLGVLWGTYYDRNDDGTMKLDANGFPTQAGQEGILGDPNPEFRYGIGNTFTYKTGDFGTLSLNVLFEGSYGGQMWNGTKGALYFFGTHQETATTTTISAADATTVRNYAGQTAAAAYPQYVNPDGSYTIRGEIKQFSPTGPRVLVDETWYRIGLGSGFTGPTSQFIEDASWFRLREVTLGYTFSSEGFRRATKLQSLNVSLTGRNLALWTNYTGIDPDTNLTGSGTGQNGLGIDYFNNPATRSYIMTLRITY